jgi:hypothetical protein
VRDRAWQIGAQHGVERTNRRRVATRDGTREPEIGDGSGRHVVGARGDVRREFLVWHVDVRPRAARSSDCRREPLGHDFR